VVGDFRGLVRVSAHTNDELCKIAGLGCPYTVPLAGRPLIDHALRALCDAGVRQILVAVDKSVADAVIPLIGDLRGAEVYVAVQQDGDEEETARAVEKALGDGPAPLVVAFGDSLLAETGLEEKAASGDAIIEAPAVWHYDGTVDGVLEANTIVLDGLKRGRVGIDLSAASVQGRVQIDATAELVGAKLRGPVYIGPGARIVETYVGPYTSVGGGVTLEGAEIEHSIVLPDAEIRYPGRRLEASLVGEGAQIGRDYTLPSALRVRVGPGAQIQLS
jgi:NDP-sugar pyrophosphorylase family protein